MHGLAVANRRVIDELPTTAVVSGVLEASADDGRARARTGASRSGRLVTRIVPIKPCIQPDHEFARCWREVYYSRPNKEPAPTEILHHMTDHATPLIAKLTAALAASYVVRLCQRERVTSMSLTAPLRDHAELCRRFRWLWSQVRGDYCKR